MATTSKVNVAHRVGTARRPSTWSPCTLWLPERTSLFVGAKNCAGGLNKAWASVIDHHLASVETDSWLFGPEDLVSTNQINFFDEFLLEAANTGVTVQFSSGDSGDQADTSYGKSVNFPASSPWATGVGGTSTEIGATGNIVFQTGGRTITPS